MNPILTKLCDAGLNLQAVFNCEDLPADTGKQIQGTDNTPLHDCQLLLLGNGGTKFWQELKHRQPILNGADNPVDRYVLEVLEENLSPSDLLKIEYPGNHFAPLTQLGRLCGWHHSSPMGLGIHSEYGLWFAYRALVLVTRQFEPSPLWLPTADSNTGRLSPCQRCTSKPCIAACPASAVSIHAFQLKTCTAHRLFDDSNCRLTCHARSACPVGIKHHYSPEQMAYHYQHSLDSIRKYQ
jgi:epoxyqueuosine reductase